MLKPAAKIQKKRGGGIMVSSHMLRTIYDIF